MSGDDLEVLRALRQCVEDIDHWADGESGHVLQDARDVAATALSRLEAQEPTGEQPALPECPARKALKVYADAKNWICPRCMNADNPDPINCGMLRWFGPGAPDGEGHGYEVARMALSTPCSSCPTYSGMTQDGLDGAIAYDALLAERDALTRKVEKLVEALERAARNLHEASELLRGHELAGCVHSSALEALAVVEHEKEQG